MYIYGEFLIYKNFMAVKRTTYLESLPKCLGLLIWRSRTKGQGVPRIWEGGGTRFFFFRFWNSFAMRIAMGIRGHAPPRTFFKTMQFCAF